MPCYYPIDVWRAKAPNPSGKTGISFSPRDADVSQPLQVPCGKCTGCRADQALMWSIRAYHESTQHVNNSFITLTYDDAHLPEDGKIVKKDLQDFFKRLRKRLHPQKIRYIACGEYGEQTRRPHYHAIIFGEDFTSDRIDLSDSLYSSYILTETWQSGQVSIAPVTMSSICYVCGYVTKKIGDADTFSLMSRRPGIGHRWLEKYSDDIARTGSVTIEGREFPVPKRYLDWDSDNLDFLKAERARIVQQRDPLLHRESLRSRETNRNALLSKKREKL